MSGRSKHHEHFRESHRRMLRAHIEAPSLTKTNGSSAAQVLQEVLHLPRKRTLWERLFTWEKLLVAGREVKGWVVPQPLGIALIVTMLGVGGYMYKSSSAELREQRDLLIRLDQRLIDKNAHDQEQYQRMEQRINDTQGHQRAVETVMNSKLSDLKAEIKR